MLQAQKLSEYVATDAAQFVELTCRLLASEKERGQVKSLLLNSLGEGMPGRDSLGASDAFGALLASAYDEAYRTGLQPFKSEAGAYSVAWNSKPAALMAEAEEALATGFPNNAVALMETALGLDPLGLDARRLMGRALAQGGQHRRAADYLQSVALRSPKDPQAWYELSRSFFCNSSLPAACSALKKSIALDSRRPDAWFLLGEMTLAAGDVPGARDVVNVIRGLAPADLRLGALEGRIAACFGAPLPGATGQSECGGQDFSGCQLAAQESHSEDGLLTH
jgi:protein O-GlcNAc transferase